MNKRIIIYLIVGIAAAILLVSIFSNEKKMSIMKNTKYETPIYYIDNNKKMDVLIIAGIHGNEVAGINASDDILENKYDWANFIVISRANIEAVNQNVRFPYYMSDLNRTFPGKISGTDTEKISYEIYSFIEELKPDIILDLHEWHRKYDEDSRYNSNGLIFNLKNIEFYEAINQVYNDYKDKNPDSKVMLEPGSIEGTVNKEVFDGLGIPIVTIESNMNDNIEDRVNFHLYIIENLIKNYRMDE